MYQSGTSRRKEAQFQSSSRTQKRRTLEEENDDVEDAEDDGGVRMTMMMPKKRLRGPTATTAKTTMMMEEEGVPEGKYVKYGDPLGRPDRPDRPKRQKPQKMDLADSFVPASFSSSRRDRTAAPASDSSLQLQQSASRFPASRPEDFMDNEDLEALGYAAGMKTNLPFASLHHGSDEHPPSSASLGQLLQFSLKEELVSASHSSVGRHLAISPCHLFLLILSFLFSQVRNSCRQWDGRKAKELGLRLAFSRGGSSSGDMAQLPAHSENQHEWLSMRTTRMISATRFSSRRWPPRTPL